MSAEDDVPPPDPDRAWLVGVARPGQDTAEAESLLEELADLCTTLGLSIAGRDLVRLREPHARLLVGTGRAETIVESAREARCGIIVFDDELTPAQQRNWEKLAGRSVIDRHEVILDIFASRARTREATLQVELARLEYERPRLRRAWTHLSRQRGGGGGRGGAQRGEGETQLELDARMIGEKLAKLKAELEEVVRHRAVQRRQRHRTPVPTAAIVGYTNAGKSSLLNRLTGSAVYAADQLFATLDPTTRRLALPSGRPLLVTDTVGFVRRLPHRLVEAFKATLEEAIVADFILHVVDASHPEAAAHRATTEAVLAELGAEERPCLVVHNKIDRLPPDRRDALRAGLGDDEVAVSAVTGEGCDELLARCERLASADAETLSLRLPHDRYDLLGRLHAAGAVSRQTADDDGIVVVGRIPARLRAAVAPFVTG